MRDNMLRTSVFNHYDVIGQQSNRIRWKKREIKAITLFSVIQRHLGLIGKCAVNFLLVLINFFARCYVWDATSENREKIGDLAPMQSVLPNISGKRGRTPHIIFARIVKANECLTALSLTVFTQWNFVADLTPVFLWPHDVSTNTNIIYLFTVYKMYTEMELL